MPLILAPDHYADWLTADADTAAKLMRPFPADLMQVVASGEGLRSEPE